MTTRRISITTDDMARLRELIGEGWRGARRDVAHLAELDRELDRAEVIPGADVRPDVVTMHSVVRVRDIDSGSSMIYTLVFPGEADLERGRISILAPVGTALLGYRTGDVFEWTTPRGRRRLQIERVLFQPEAAAAGGAR